jgi:hypothetical protein
MDNPHIPDDVSYEALIDATPNYVNAVGFVPSPARLHNMTARAMTFECAHIGNPQSTFLRVYDEIHAIHVNTLSGLRAQYDLFVCHTRLGYSEYRQAPTMREYIEIHVTCLVLWYGLLIEYMISRTV